MNQGTERLLKAYALLATQGELLATIEEMNLHFMGEALTACRADELPGVVLRWLHCYADLELWHEAFNDREPMGDRELALDLAAQLEELGIEAVDELPCHACDYRKRCL